MCDLTNPAFTDEEKAREFLEASRWPDGPFCPFCGQPFGMIQRCVSREVTSMTSVRDLLLNL